MDHLTTTCQPTTRPLAGRSVAWDLLRYNTPLQRMQRAGTWPRGDLAESHTTGRPIDRHFAVMVRGGIAPRPNVPRSGAIARLFGKHTALAFPTLQDCFCQRLWRQYKSPYRQCQVDICASKYVLGERNLALALTRATPGRHNSQGVFTLGSGFCPPWRGYSR